MLSRTALVAAGTGVAAAALSRSTILRARHGHGGTQHTHRRIERLVLLEEALEQPTSERSGLSKGRSTHCTGSETAHFLREASVRVAAVRESLLPCAAVPAATGLSSSLLEPQVTETTAHNGTMMVTSLTQFLAECKRWRQSIGCVHTQQERLSMRQGLRNFWTTNAESAIQCCSMLGRDFGFVAAHGLSDDSLHLSFSAMQTSLEALAVNTEMCACVDMTRSLQYLARELAWLERDSSASSKGTPCTTAKDAAALAQFRSTLTDLAIERIFFFFVLNAPKRMVNPSEGQNGSLPASNEYDDDMLAQDESASTATMVGQYGATLGSVDDALSALEVLALLNVSDTSPKVLANVQKRFDVWQVQQLKQYNSLSSSVLAVEPDQRSASTSVLLSHQYLVSKVFEFVSLQRWQLKFTSVVQAFALLRVFLPLLWPPYLHNDNTTGVNTQISGNNKRDGRASLKQQRDTLARVTWSLAKALKSRDVRFTNPYHLVKITATLARLPSFLLSPLPRHAFSSNGVKREMRSLTLPTRETVYAAAAAGKEDAAPPQYATDMAAADFWRYIVSKACIFVPNLSLKQRRQVCWALHVCLREKRSHLLGTGKSSASFSSPPSSSSSSWGSGKEAFAGPPRAQAGHIAQLSDSPDDLLLPLIEEMVPYVEDFEVSARAGCTRPGGLDRPKTVRSQRNKAIGKNQPRQDQSGRANWSQRPQQKRSHINGSPKHTQGPSSE